VAGLREFEDVLNNTDEIELTVTGRTSGRESSRPVWFVRQGDTVYLLPVTGSDTQWYRNVLTTPNVRLSAGGADYRARVTPITDSAEVERIVQLFRDGYGAGDVEEYYPKHDVAVEVRLD
jgi:deazaflavin-dependent oxidoreductase (nitroreductase family)